MTDNSFFSANLVLAYGAYLLATLSPGPSNLAIMAIAMNAGRRPALAFAAGVVSGSLFWALLTALGLSAIVTRYSQALLFLKLVGGVYLLWLAIRAARAAMVAPTTPEMLAVVPQETIKKLYLRGLALHLTNPKAILAWLAIVSLALPRGASTLDALGVVFGCVGLGVLVFGGYALAFSTLAARRIYSVLRRWLEGALAFVFAVAGFKLLFSVR
jgi:threonine efflux protein